MRVWFFLLGLPILLHADLIWHSDMQKPFEMTIQLTSPKITQGDFLNVEADLHYPSSYQVQIDSLVDHLTWSANPLTPQWKIVQSSVSSLSHADMQIQHLKAKITPLTTGSLDLSFLTVTFEPNDNSHSPLPLLTPVFTVQVLPLSTQNPSLPLASLIPLEPQFPLGLTQANREFLIENPKRLKEEQKHIQRYLEAHSFPWLTLMILLGIGTIGWAAYLTHDRWPKLRTPPIKVLLSPQQQIDQAFQALQQRHLLEQGLIQTYSIELTSILLKMLRDRLGWKTKELTTAEVAQALKASLLLSKTQKQEALSFLAEMDQIKFAGKIPSLKEAQQMEQYIQNFTQQLYKN